MNSWIAAIESGLTLLNWLTTTIPQWIERAKQEGELTEEQESAYRARQKLIFSQLYAQPEQNVTEIPTPPTAT